MKPYDMVVRLQRFDRRNTAFARRLRPANRTLIWLDDLLGYGRHQLPPQA